MITCNCMVCLEEIHLSLENIQNSNQECLIFIRNERSLWELSNYSDRSFDDDEMTILINAIRQLNNAIRKV